MSESLEALRNEMFETMQRMRQRRSTPPLPPGITRGEINALMMLSIMEARGEVVRPGMLAGAPMRRRARFRKRSSRLRRRVLSCAGVARAILAPSRFP